MYLHLGQSVVVPHREILGIFDLDNTTCSKHTRNFLTLQERQHRVINVCEDIPKSFVLCEERGAVIVYISQISSQTLLKRFEDNSLFENGV